MGQRATDFSLVGRASTRREFSRRLPITQDRAQIVGVRSCFIASPRFAFEIKEWTMIRAVIILGALATTAASAVAQVNEKRERCLSEAVLKGLYSRNPGKGSAAFNRYTMPQRGAFMRECMSRR